jgi:four helix bundle protein
MEMTNRFHAHDLAMEMATALRPLLDRIGRRDRDLAGQLRRAAASVVLNLAEGARRMGKDRLHFYRVAAGSAAETQSGLELAGAWGYLDPAEVKPAQILLDRVLAMLWRLTHARR